MDRRQRKTREAIFSAFIYLLAEKDYSQITVGQIINKADVGRATFYAHFETKDHLLKALCHELFCHILDAANGTEHDHIFRCDAPDSVFLHLLQHLQNNDNQILQLLKGRNNALFLGYFKENLHILVQNQLSLFAARKDARIPESLWIEHIASTFTETVRWWIANGMAEAPQTVAEYFYLTV